LFNCLSFVSLLSLSIPSLLEIALLPFQNPA
jgi:hypothetical protein